MRTAFAVAGAVWTVAVIGAVSLRAEADAQTASTPQEFKNIVIQGVPRLHMRGEKPEEQPKLDPKSAISDYLTQNTDLISPGDRLLVNLPLMLPQRVGSGMVATPWHRLLWSPPVLNLTIANAGKAQVSRWRLTVTDDTGTVFRTIQGKGQMPKRLEWDGLGEKQDPLKVGHSYSCALSLLDKADVPSYQPLKAVRLSSYIHVHKRGLRILLDTPTLFSRGSSLSEDGQARLREARDWLRDYYGGSIRVDVYGSDGELARQQAESVRNALAESLQLDSGDIKARGRILEPDRYARTEINAK